MAATNFAEVLSSGASPFKPKPSMSAAFRTWATDDALIVVVGSESKKPDLALAQALRHLEDRDLWLVLPAGTETPTLRRAAWLRPKIRVWVHDADELTEVALPARAMEFDRFREPIRVAVAGLGERSDWVAPLLDWARSMPAVVEASREGYLDFHCDGRSVLQIAPTAGGLSIRAGTDWSKPQPPHQATEKLVATGPLLPDQVHALVAAASRSSVLRLRGEDKDNAEHRLQARLRPHHVGLSDWRREMPAVRPTGACAGPLKGGRGFIDFFGVSKTGLHIVETKIGTDDPFLVLQGLDYWTWAMGQRDRLAVLYALNTTEPKVSIDYVVSAKKVGGQLLGPYAPAQAWALDGEIDWGFHVVQDWQGDDPIVKSLPRRTLPDGY